MEGVVEKRWSQSGEESHCSRIDLFIVTWRRVQWTSSFMNHVQPLNLHSGLLWRQSIGLSWLYLGYRGLNKWLVNLRIDFYRILRLRYEWNWSEWWSINKLNNTRWLWWLWKHRGRWLGANGIWIELIGVGWHILHPILSYGDKLWSHLIRIFFVFIFF